MMLGVTKLQAQGNQKIAFIDTEYILQNIPEYTDAQEEINQMSANWVKELRALQNKIDKLKRDYQTESVLLSDDMKNRRETEIAEKEQALADLQSQYFGPEGEYPERTADCRLFGLLQQLRRQQRFLGTSHPDG